jgi:hypothetical protein
MHLPVYDSSHYVEYSTVHCIICLFFVAHPACLAQIRFEIMCNILSTVYFWFWKYTFRKLKVYFQISESILSDFWKHYIEKSTMLCTVPVLQPFIALLKSYGNAHLKVSAPKLSISSETVHIIIINKKSTMLWRVPRIGPCNRAILSIKIILWCLEELHGSWHSPYYEPRCTSTFRYLDEH